MKTKSLSERIAEVDKICTKCKIRKTLDCFWKCNKGALGVISECKSCRKNAYKKYYEENIEVLREDGRTRFKKFRENNKEFLLEKGKRDRVKYRDQNLAYASSYNKKLYSNNKEHFLFKNKDRYSKKSCG